MVRRGASACFIPAVETENIVHGHVAAQRIRCIAYVLVAKENFFIDCFCTLHSCAKAHYISDDPRLCTKDAILDFAYSHREPKPPLYMTITGSHTVDVQGELHSVEDFSEVINLSAHLGSEVTIRSTVEGSQADWVWSVFFLSRV